jgi:hypothetical protein
MKELRGPKNGATEWHHFWIYFWLTFGPKVVPLLEKKVKKVARIVDRETAQATALWQWSAHLVDKARALGKQPLFLNLDESSMPIVFTNGKGNIMVVNGRRAWQTEGRQQVRSADMRINFTFLAFICNVPALQPLMPQIFFVAASALRVPAWNALCANLPANVYVKRMPSAWNSSRQHLLIMRLLRLILGPLMEDYQPILYFDTAPCHMDVSIFEVLHELGIWYVVLPARLTWLFQPCDTHLFLRFKRFLKRTYQDEMAGAEGRDTVSYMVQMVVRAIRIVIQGHSWAPAFAQNGLTGDLANVSSFIKQQLQWRDLVAPSTDAPTLEQLRMCWPRWNRPFPLAAVMQALYDEAGYDGDSEDDDL